MVSFSLLPLLYSLVHQTYDKTPKYLMIFHNNYDHLSHHLCPFSSIKIKLLSVPLMLFSLPSLHVSLFHCFKYLGEVGLSLLFALLWVFVSQFGLPFLSQIANSHIYVYRVTFQALSCKSKAVMTDQQNAYFQVSHPTVSKKKKKKKKKKN